MRRALWIRIVTAMWGLWLGVALTQPMMLHPCGVHGGSAMQMVHMAGMPGMDAGATQDGATQDGAAALTDHHGTTSHGSDTTCTCLSDCCCAPPAVTPSSARADISGTATVEYATVGPSCDASTPAATVPYAHPFANGPPSSLSI